MKTETHPSYAFSVTSDAVIEVGDNGENSKTAPVRLVARTGQPIRHPYWGNIVHDLTGFKIPGGRSRIALDYAHRDDEIIGYANRFDTGTNNLVLSGALTPFKDGDRASEVIFKATSGVPYESSINFAGDKTVLQVLQEDESTEVNGFTFTGPGVVVREWELRSCAVVPSGADSGTSVELFNSDSKVSVNVMEATDMDLHSKFTATDPEPEEEQTEVVEAEAVDTATDEPSAEAATEGTTEVAAVEAQPEPTALSAEEGKRMVATFGPRGAVAFINGKSFDETLREMFGELQAENAQQKQEIAELKAQIHKFADAGDAPAKFSSVDKLDTDGLILPVRLAK